MRSLLVYLGWPVSLLCLMKIPVLVQGSGLGSGWEWWLYKVWHPEMTRCYVVLGRGWWQGSSGGLPPRSRLPDCDVGADGPGQGALFGVPLGPSLSTNGCVPEWGLSSGAGPERYLEITARQDIVNINYISLLHSSHLHIAPLWNFII